MSLADERFIETCKSILFDGESTENEDCRALWTDTHTYAYTIKKFGIVNHYDLQKEFPALTLRKTNIKAAIDEILWIYQKRSNDTKLLNSKIWDQWADQYGTIGKAYGYQIAQRSIIDGQHTDINLLRRYIKAFDTFMANPEFYHYKDASMQADGTLAVNFTYDESYKRENNFDELLNYIDGLHIGDHVIPANIHIYADQINKVLYQLRNTPFSRRIMTNMYNHHDSFYMMLEPCAYSCLFNVSNDGEHKVLSMILNQRSQDMLVAGNWNVVQYAALLMMIAHSVDMIPGTLIHVIGDCHIYDRHIPIVKDLIQKETYDAPIVKFNPGEHKNFFEYTPDMFEVEDYNYAEVIKNIPVAR